MNTIGKRIKDAREKIGLTQPQLAEACGWESQGRISNYENNLREPKLIDLKHISSALKIPVSSLLEDFLLDDNKVTEKPSTYTLHNTYYDFVVVQSYQANQKSLNTPNAYIATKSSLTCPIEIIESTGSESNNLRVLFMNNDSMMPTFSKNTLLLVDISDFEMQSGLVYLINWYGEERIKRVFKDGKNSFKLKSDNQHNSLYADDLVDFNNNDDVKVLGRIVWYAGTL